MSVWLLRLWARFQGAIIAITSAILMALAIFYHGKSAGREQAERKQREVDDEARNRMDDVKPSSPSDVIDSLRKGNF